MATDYVFEKPTDEDFDAIVQFLLDDFLVREPLLSSLGATREEELPLFTAQTRRGIDSGISYIVRSVPQGKIVRARLTAIRERPKAGEQKDAFGVKEKPSPTVGEVHRFLSEFANKA
ncbi:acetyltransferase [Aphelenchoides avenae]|nr:acetyltransferase [Aphelenchus avenae]